MLEQLQQWIREEMAARRLTTLDEVAWQAGVSRPTISRIMAGRDARGRAYHPSEETCRALAVWLGRTLAEVRYAAERTVAEPEQFTSEKTVLQRRLLAVFDSLPPEQQEEVARIAELKRELWEEQQATREPRSESQTEPEAAGRR